MMVLYNTDTTNDSSFMGSTIGNAVKTSFWVDSDSSYDFYRSNSVWDRNTNLPVLEPNFGLTIGIPPQASGYYLYLDKFYAIREFSLNRLLMLQSNSNWYY
jgi:hypothetical protein